MSAAAAALLLVAETVPAGGLAPGAAAPGGAMGLAPGAGGPPPVAAPIAPALPASPPPVANPLLPPTVAPNGTTATGAPVVGVPLLPPRPRRAPKRP